MRRSFDPFGLARSLGGHPFERSMRRPPGYADPPAPRRVDVRRAVPVEHPVHKHPVHKHPVHKHPVHKHPVPEHDEDPSRLSEREWNDPTPVAQPSRGAEPVSERAPAKPRLVAIEPPSDDDGAASLDEIERVKERLARDAQREVELKTRAVLSSFLDVVDDLDRALTGADAAGDADRALLDGVEMVRTRFLDKLAAHGVEREQSIGQTFDPAQHEALATAPATHPDLEGRVVAVVRPGYSIHGKLLRPAGVVVGKRG